MTKLWGPLVLGTVLVLSWIGMRNRHRFRYTPTALDAVELVRLASDGFIAEEIEIEPGVVLRGLVRTPAPSTSTWLFMLAGNGADLLAGARRLGVDLAAGSGWGIAAWAYRGFDGSGGTPDAVAFADDTEKLWTRLQTRFGADPTRTHLVSFSLGTALALRIAGVSSARGAPPASLVLLSPYERIQVTQDTWWAPWSFADRYDALAHVHESTSPVLVVYGSADDAFPPGTARSLANALGARARVIEIPGRGHAGWLDDEMVLEPVRAFLREHSLP